MPALPMREDHLLLADVDEHALEHLVEVERLGRDVLVVPGQRAVLAAERHGGRAVERGVLIEVPRLAGIHGLACATPQ